MSVLVDCYTYLRKGMQLGNDDALIKSKIEEERG